MKALAELKWKPPETDDQYKARVSLVYEMFRERAAVVRAALTGPKPKATAAAPGAARAAKSGAN